MNRISLPPLVLLAVACGPKTIEIGGSDTGAAFDTEADGLDDTGLLDTGDTGDTGEVEPDDSEWDDARLEILSPGSGEFWPWGEEVAFEAVVYYADGTEADFDEIQWSTDVDASWAPTGASFGDADVEVGTHAFTAEARLPNGDRLAYTVGGVLIQSPYAGTYSGNLSVEGTVDAYSIGCAGGALLYVDAYGELVEGEGSCLISLQGFELDMTFIFDLANAAGDMDGEAGLDIYGFYQVPVDMTGALDEDGEMTGSFAYDSDYFGVSGTLEATRISRTIGE